MSRMMEEDPGIVIGDDIFGEAAVPGVFQMDSRTAVLFDQVAGDVDPAGVSEAEAMAVFADLVVADGALLRLVQTYSQVAVIDAICGDGDLFGVVEKDSGPRFGDQVPLDPRVGGILK